MKAAHEHQLIRELSTSPEFRVAVGRREMQFRTTNSLVRSPIWEIGLQKTGYITEAGRCLVMQATLAGRQLIMVFLDSTGKYSRLGDAERVRRWVTEFAPAHAPVPACRRPQIFRLQLPPQSNSRSERASGAMAQRGRDLPCSGLETLQPGLFEAIGRGRDRQARDQVALVVTDAGGHAANPQFQFFVVAGRALLGHTGEPRSSAGRSVMLLRVCPARPVRMA